MIINATIVLQPTSSSSDVLIPCVLPMPSVTMIVS